MANSFKKRCWFTLSIFCVTFMSILHQREMLKAGTIYASSLVQREAATVGVPTAGPGIAKIREHQDCLNRTALDEDIPPPTLLNISSKDVVFMHMGKAGGGTFRTRTKQWWNIFIPRCHPFPKQCRQYIVNMTEVYDYNVTSENVTRPSYLMSKIGIISIRDPVDRFVSAFYWRAKKWSKKNLTATGHGKEIEAFTIFDKHKHNVNLLAEALCSDDERTAEMAREDMRNIYHSKWTIGYWIFSPWTNTDTLSALVLEPGFDFNAQIDATIEWVNRELEYSYFGNFSAFAARKAHVDALDCQVAMSQLSSFSSSKNAAGAMIQDKIDILQKSRHSSVMASQEEKAPPPPPPLSKRGEQCLAQYYRKEYKIIAHILLKGGACKTEICWEALKSILKRRAPDLLAEVG